MSESGSANSPLRRVLVTGAAGHVGSRLVASLAAEPGPLEHIVALDVREVPKSERHLGVTYRTGDIRDPALRELVRDERVDAIVHLAAVVAPGRDSTPELEYSIDVEGTENVLAAALAAGVRWLGYTSSGAAYGYHADNPPWLSESDPLRGNDAFAYARHKRLVEERLAQARAKHPELAQLVLRVGTILGESIHSPVTAIFERRLVIGVAGAATPFVFVWDDDVVRCLREGLLAGRTGVYNLAGGGAVPLREVARRLGKPYLPLPAGVLRAVLGTIRALGLSPRGAEQVDFLRYRPVLSNERLVRELGFEPRYRSEECLDRYARARATA